MAALVPDKNYPSSRIALKKKGKEKEREEKKMKRKGKEKKGKEKSVINSLYHHYLKYHTFECKNRYEVGGEQENTFKMLGGKNLICYVDGTVVFRIFFFFFFLFVFIIQMQFSFFLKNKEKGKEKLLEELR